MEDLERTGDCEQDADAQQGLFGRSEWSEEREQSSRRDDERQRRECRWAFAGLEQGAKIERQDVYRRSAGQWDQSTRA
jgi:hypothetical protein